MGKLIRAVLRGGNISNGVPLPDTSLWSFITRELGKTIKEARQMITETTETIRSDDSVGAASHDTENWHSIGYSRWWWWIIQPSLLVA
jgi:hypothetical protein